MKKNKKIKILGSPKQKTPESKKAFLIYILILLFILGIVFVFLKKSSREQSQLTEIQEIHFPISNSENTKVGEKSRIQPEVVDLNDLRLSFNLTNRATDKMSNISIKYPQDWKIVSTNPLDRPLEIRSPDYTEPFRSPKNTEYSAFVDTGAVLFFAKTDPKIKNLSLNDYINTINHYIEGSFKKLKKNNIEAVQYSYDMNWDSNKNYEIFDNLLIVKNGNLYIITLAYRKFDEDKYKNLLTEIASTIEF